VSLQPEAPWADALFVRSVLEYLGFLEPDRTRREPLALPAWSRRILRLAPLALAIASTLVLALLRALLA
jgi:hypothetical protein